MPGTAPDSMPGMPDIPASQAARHLPGLQGYAYILLHPGIPCVFYDHVYSDGLLRPSLWRRLKSLVAKTPRLDGSAFTLLPLDRCILALIALRRKHGITSHSSVRPVGSGFRVWKPAPVLPAHPVVRLIE